MWFCERGSVCRSKGLKFCLCEVLSSLRFVGCREGLCQDGLKTDLQGNLLHLLDLQLHFTALVCCFWKCLFQILGYPGIALFINQLELSRRRVATLPKA